MAVGPEAQLMDFAQKLIDDGIVIDVAKLETITGNALARAAAGPPSSNPLLNEAPAAAAPAPRAAAPAARPASSSSTPALAGAPQFPFDQIGVLDDPALAQAFRQQLIDAGKSGASDLHLSAGSRPYVRKHRARSRRSPNTS